MAEKKAMIKIRQLKIAFGNKIVLDDLDLDVYEGETLAIIGPSGTGKSTIIKVLTGLLAPTSGSVLVDGQETKDYGGISMLVYWRRWRRGSITIL